MQRCRRTRSGWCVDRPGPRQQSADSPHSARPDARGTGGRRSVAGQDIGRAAAPGRRRIDLAAQGFPRRVLGAGDPRVLPHQGAGDRRRLRSGAVVARRGAPARTSPVTLDGQERGGSLVRSSPSAAAESCRPVSRLYVLSIVQFTMLTTSAPTMRSARIWGSRLALTSPLATASLTSSSKVSWRPKPRWVSEPMVTSIAPIMARYASLALTSTAAISPKTPVSRSGTAESVRLNSTARRWSNRFSARAWTMSCRVAKWLKNVRLATSARSQMASILVASMPCERNSSNAASSIRSRTSRLRRSVRFTALILPNVQRCVWMHHYIDTQSSTADLCGTATRWAGLFRAVLFALQDQPFDAIQVTAHRVVTQCPRSGSHQGTVEHVFHRGQHVDRHSGAECGGKPPANFGADLFSQWFQLFLVTHQRCGGGGRDFGLVGAQHRECVDLLGDPLVRGLVHVDEEGHCTDEPQIHLGD